MPVVGFSVRFGHDDKINKRVEILFVAYCDRDELLKKYGKWHRLLLKEIPELESQIDITPHIHNMMTCIRKISRVVIKDDLTELIENTRVLQEFMHPIIIDAESLKELTYPLEIDKVPFICESGDSPDDIIYNVEMFPLHLMQIVFYADSNL